MRGSVARFDAESYEALDRLLKEWTRMILLRFDVYPLIDPEAAQTDLRERLADPGGRAWPGCRG
jgi:hypothetical protein